MKKFELNNPYLFLVLLAAVALGSFVVLELRVPVVPGPTPNRVASSVDTSNWKIYRDERGAFELKYPFEWFIQGTGLENDTNYSVAEFMSPLVNIPDTDVEVGAVINVTSKRRKEGSKSDYTCPTGYQVGTISNLSEEDIVVNGLQAHKATFKYVQSNTTLMCASFATKDYFYDLHGNFAADYQLDKYIPVFDEILRNFRTLEPTASPQTSLGHKICKSPSDCETSEKCFDREMPELYKYGVCWPNNEPRPSFLNRIIMDVR